MKFVKRLERNEVDTSPATMIEEMIKDIAILRMMNKGKKEATINANLRAIRSFFNLLDKEGYISRNPVKGVKLVK